MTRTALEPRVFVPAGGPDDWKRFLAQPDKQWRSGYSARTIAHAWQESDGGPIEILATLEGAFPGVEPLFVVPEWRVPLPGGDRPSQNDVWALCRADSGLISVAVEGKVGEPFGPTVGEWMKGASSGKLERMAFLCACLGLDSPPDSSIRYQLLHRTVSAIIEAERFHAAHAVMLVHSFHPEDLWFGDYVAFTGLLGGSAEKNRLTPIPSAGPTTLHIGWVHGDEKYLQA